MALASWEMAPASFDMAPASFNMALASCEVALASYENVRRSAKGLAKSPGAASSENFGLLSEAMVAAVLTCAGNNRMSRCSQRTCQTMEE